VHRISLLAEGLKNPTTEGTTSLSSESVPLVAQPSASTSAIPIMFDSFAIASFSDVPDGCNISESASCSFANLTGSSLNPDLSLALLACEPTEML
jgi:hypothetical protein